jgi:hypothetical protein
MDPYFDIESTPVANPVHDYKPVVLYSLSFIAFIVIVSWIHEGYTIYQHNESNVKRLIRKGPPRGCYEELNYAEEIIHKLINADEHDCKLYFETIEQSSVPNPMEAFTSMMSRVTGSVIGTVIRSILAGQDTLMQIAIVIGMVYLLYQCMMKRNKSNQDRYYQDQQQRITDAYRLQQYLREERIRNEPYTARIKPTLYIKQIE